MKYRILATVILLIVLAIAYFILGSADSQSAAQPKQDDPGGLVLH
jgi:lipopolysaccharide export system protein LptC